MSVMMEIILCGRRIVFDHCVPGRSWAGVSREAAMKRKEKEKKKGKFEEEEKEKKKMLEEIRQKTTTFAVQIAHAPHVRGPDHAALQK